MILLRTKVIFQPIRCDEGDSISELFHENSKVPIYLQEESRRLEAEASSRMDKDERVRRIVSKAFKVYRGMKATMLPKRLKPSDFPLEKAIRMRRTFRQFAQKAISMEELSRLLSYAYGITGFGYFEDGSVLPLRATPSGGALYPLEIYPVIFRVDGIPEGIYHWNVRDHSLERLSALIPIDQWVDIFLGQSFIKNCGLLLLISAIFHRSKCKYGERGYRYVLLDAGHVAQNIYLIATATGLGAAALGGFVDDRLNQILRLDGVDEAVIYAMAIGVKAAAPLSHAPVGLVIRAHQVRSPNTSLILRDPWAYPTLEILWPEMAKYFPKELRPWAPHILARTRKVDVLLKSSLSRGARQVVVLHAASDSRAWRLSCLKHRRLFEVDEASKLLPKKRIIPRLRRNAPAVTYVPVAPERADLYQELSARGFKISEPSVFVWEEGSHYLNKEEVLRLLIQIREMMKPQDTLILGYPAATATTSPYCFRPEPFDLEELFGRVGFRPLRRSTSMEAIAEFGLRTDEPDILEEIVELAVSQEKGWIS